MLHKALPAITTLALLAATAATAHAQLRVQMRTTPQIRVMPSPSHTHFNPKQLTISRPVPAGTHFNPKEIAVDKPVPWQKSHTPAHPIRDYAGTASSQDGAQGGTLSSGGTRHQKSEGGVTGFTRKVIGVTK